MLEILPKPGKEKVGTVHSIENRTIGSIRILDTVFLPNPKISYKCIEKKFLFWKKYKWVRI